MVIGLIPLHELAGMAGAGALYATGERDSRLLEFLSREIGKHVDATASVPLLGPEAAPCTPDRSRSVRLWSEI